VTLPTSTNRLDRAVDEAYDHVLGPSDAEITLVEYGSYADPASRLAHGRVAAMRSQFGHRLRYVFRHRPVPGSDIARRAAELVESYSDPVRFWNVHVSLITQADEVTEEHLHTIAADLVLEGQADSSDNDSISRVRARIDADVESAAASGVLITPTFFINGRRYDGPWDASSFSEAMLGSPGHVVHAVALDFAKWAPSTGILLLLTTVIAVVLANSTFSSSFNDFWNLPLGFTFGSAAFELSLRHWINDGLLVVFFLVVGL